jgi:hypothetical protein
VSKATITCLDKKWQADSKVIEDFEWLERCHEGEVDRALRMYRNYMAAVLVAYKHYKYVDLLHICMTISKLEFYKANHMYDEWKQQG